MCKHYIYGLLLIIVMAQTQIDQSGPDLYIL